MSLPFAALLERSLAFTMNVPSVEGHVNERFVELSCVVRTSSAGKWYADAANNLFEVTAWH